MFDTGIGLLNTQTVTISPRQLQSISILQMDAIQLEEYLAQQLEENPILEPTDTAAPDPLFYTESAESVFSGRNAAGDTNSVSALDMAEAADTGATLTAFLRDQLERKKLPQQLLAICLYLAESLNEQGYLQQADIQVLYEELPCPPETIDRAIHMLQSLDPAGVGARSLSECLLLQLERSGQPCELACRIVRYHLQELAEKRFSTLEKQLRKPLAEILCAVEQILALDPKPGSSFSTAAQPQYIRPDVTVTRLDRQLQVTVNDREARSIGLNSFYLEMEKAAEDREASDYLHEKIADARWLISCLRQRNSTLKACAACIVQLQQAFFLNEGPVVPMSLSDIASIVGFHESTVSRALQGKYISCGQGIFPFTFFLSRSVSTSNGSVSAQQIKDIIALLVRKENKSEPLSDQQLQTALQKECGAAISRRTVAKYRTALQIPPVSQRRAFVSSALA